MATPAYLQDLALGFTLTEGVAPYEDVVAIEVASRPEGFQVDVVLKPSTALTRLRPRKLEGRSSCGLCGVQRLKDVMRPLPRAGRSLKIEARAVGRALAEIAEGQLLGQLTRATHAAGFADPDGEVICLREDVGRHNALDKLAGALLTHGVRPSSGFVVVTSRCSFEMVEKTARMGAEMIVAVSAATELAVQKAEETGVTLVAVGRADGFMVFTGLQRIRPGQTQGVSNGR